VELHGFLSYLVKCNVEGRLYKVLVTKASSPRQHPFARRGAFHPRFYENPRCGEVYNIGGGRDNSVSILEAFEHAAALSGKKMNYEYVDQNRAGDHIATSVTFPR